MAKGTRLNQVLTFTNVAPAAIVALPHNINVNGVALKPDFLFRDNGDFAIISCTTTLLTVQNNSVGAATLTVWLEHQHTFDRVYGAGSVTNLSPQPFVPAAGGGGGNTVQLPPVIFDDFIDSYGFTPILDPSGVAEIDASNINWPLGRLFLYVVDLGNDAVVNLTSDVNTIALGSGVATFEARAALFAVPTLVEDGNVKIGMSSNRSSGGAMGDGMGFLAGPGQVASGPENWHAWTTNITNQWIDTGIPLDTAIHKFRIIYDPADGGSVNWYIDGVLVATSTTNLPDGISVSAVVGVQNISLVSAPFALGVYVDYIYFNTPSSFSGS